MDRDAALALLREQHEFPGPFEFRVVVRPAQVTSTVSAMVAGAGAGAALEHVGQRESRKGTYVALQVRIRLRAPEAVLDVYEVIKSLDVVVSM